MKVILIEKSRGILRKLFFILVQNGYEVFYANSEKEGLAVCINKSVNLVITQLNIGNFGSIEMIKVLKRIMPEVCIIVFGYYERNIYDILTGLGVDMVVNMPTDETELITSMECTGNFMRNKDDFYYAF